MPARNNYEKQIESGILTYLKLKGIYAWKNNSTGVFDPKTKKFRKNKNPFVLNGVSDILGILPNGSLLAIEVKLDNTHLTKKTYPTEDQKTFMENINKHRGVAFVARSVEDVASVLSKILGPYYALN